MKHSVVFNEGSCDWFIKQSQATVGVAPNISDIFYVRMVYS